MSDDFTIQDCYELLEVEAGTSVEGITQAYNRKRALLLSREKTTQNDVLAQLEQAHELLINYKNTHNGEIVLQSRALMPQDHNVVSIVNPVDTIGATSAIVLCFRCGAANPPQAMMCIQCKEQLARACPQCGKPVQLDQAVCLRCQTIVAEYDQRRYLEAMSVQKRIHQQRRENQTYATSLEKIQIANEKRATVFWIIVLLVSSILIFLALIAPGFFENLFS